MIIALVVVGIVALVFAASMVSAAETVIWRLDLVRVLALDDEDPRVADLLWLLQHRGTSLNATLTLTVILRSATAVAMAWLFLQWLMTIPALLTAAVLTAVVSLIAAEMAPRSAALTSLDTTGLRLARGTRRIVAAVGPIVRVLVAVGRIVGRAGRDASGPFEPDQPLESVFEELDDDELQEDERAMIRSIVEMGDTIAREIMVPRPDMVLVDRGYEIRELVNTIVEHGYSRLPVYEGDREQILGIVYAKDVLRRVALQPDLTGWSDLIRPATFIPETKQIDDLLRDLRGQSVHIAMVVDEYGATTGLVTIEDILEEIVGEIVDEHDNEDPLVEELEGGAYVIDARLPVDDLNDLLGSDLPDDDWDTVGGLVVGALGRVPEIGESVELDSVTFVTMAVQGRRVSKVRAHRAPRTVDA